jgi:cell wall-associated NlpC family hydrolase
MIQPPQDMLASMLRSTAPTQFALLPLLAIAALLTGCADAPNLPPAGTAGRIVVEPRSANTTVGAAIADLAMGMVGTRYRFGGTDPQQGFDCSGLVFYTYSQAGYEVPRTSQEQFRAARKIALGEANAGDLMFFQDQSKLSHVGIYLGDGMFVHAPASGQNVAVASLDTPYYQQHLVAIGRLLPN